MIVDFCFDVGGALVVLGWAAHGCLALPFAVHDAAGASLSAAAPWVKTVAAEGDAVGVLAVFAAAPVAPGAVVTLRAGAFAAEGVSTGDDLADVAALAPEWAFLALLAAIGAGRLPPLRGAAALPLFERARRRRAGSTFAGENVAAGIAAAAFDAEGEGGIVSGWLAGGADASALVCLAPGWIGPVDTAWGALERPEPAPAVPAAAALLGAGFVGTARMPPAAAPGVMLLVEEEGRIRAMSRAAERVPFAALLQRFAALAPQLAPAVFSRLRAELAQAAPAPADPGFHPGFYPGSDAGSDAGSAGAGSDAGSDAGSAGAGPTDTEPAGAKPAGTWSAGEKKSAGAKKPARALLVLEHDGRGRDLREVLRQAGVAAAGIEVALAGVRFDEGVRNAVAGARRDGCAVGVATAETLAAARGRPIIWAPASMLVQHDVLPFLAAVGEDGARIAARDAAPPPLARIAVWDALPPPAQPASASLAEGSPAALVQKIARRALPFAIALDGAAAAPALAVPTLLSVPGRLLAGLARLAAARVALRRLGGDYFAGEAPAAERLDESRLQLAFDLRAIRDEAAAAAGTKR